MVELHPPVYSDCLVLAQMLNTDKTLRYDLGIDTGFQTNAIATLEFFREWCQTRKAMLYVILADKVVVGTLSLASIDHVNHTASVGYWIGSSFRRKGYCTHAFDQMIQLARRIGLHQVNARIHWDNVPSIRLWEHHNASCFDDTDEHDLYVLNLAPVTETGTA
jgi:RimJ/RimL family protein N-acetyltransferase